jgi:ATP-dependent Clp protease adapter protein ClpS
MSTQTTNPEIDELEEIDISDAFAGTLILFNDDINDMYHVIACLINICKLETKDAFKIMVTAHQKGKAVVKKGDYESLKKEAELLGKNQLTVEVQ